ncbi:hypothetical protein CW751_11500 [Brumimicrobium salinarum]|uniref:Gliding motility lipoprotein GldD n=1 Tax=Brumimicrobium salinarum TaxID=2058658 RepID=A0A2I0R0K6_9FLAO|nr:hypothetical protein [Brumimicrobium salinarum]PKR80122.1 hypothetical protein CW751_11500 [Brumimicrobium salinarum]
MKLYLIGMKSKTTVNTRTQKILIKQAAFSLLIILTYSLLSGCQAEKKPESIYKTPLKHFENEVFDLHIPNQHISEVTLTLPSCFRKIYQSISLNNEHNYHCRDKEVYISIDEIPSQSMSFYKSYFTHRNESPKNNMQVILNYAIQIKKQALSEAIISTDSKTTTYEGVPIITKSIKGKKNRYMSEIFHQFGVFQVGNKYYLLQGIMSTRNAHFMHQDLIEIFKNIKL